MTLVIGLIVLLGLALALWLVSLPAHMPADTRVTFYVVLKRALRGRREPPF